MLYVICYMLYDKTLDTYFDSARMNLRLKNISI
ncbi:MAG: hypothetical protein UR95_C0008G0002 [Parcubacteria group bacterium GW2011_GWC1_36_108]|nr:MAG: hypothetical protein UR95_C0008G0002 [Parcubacteria group bacterium GW2011_GWC1_36_108]